MQHRQAALNEVLEHLFCVGQRGHRSRSARSRSVPYMDCEVSGRSMRGEMHRTVVARQEPIAEHIEQPEALLL